MLGTQETLAVRDQRLPYGDRLAAKPGRQSSAGIGPPVTRTVQARRRASTRSVITTALFISRPPQERVTLPAGARQCRGPCGLHHYPEGAARLPGTSSPLPEGQGHG